MTDPVENINPNALKSAITGEPVKQAPTTEQPTPTKPVGKSNVSGINVEALNNATQNKVPADKKKDGGVVSGGGAGNVGLNTGSRLQSNGTGLVSNEQIANLGNLASSVDGNKPKTEEPKQTEVLPSNTPERQTVDSKTFLEQDLQKTHISLREDLSFVPRTSPFYNKVNPATKAFYTPSETKKIETQFKIDEIKNNPVALVDYKNKRVKEIQDKIEEKRNEVKKEDFNQKMLNPTPELISKVKEAQGEISNLNSYKDDLQKSVEDNAFTFQSAKDHISNFLSTHQIKVTPRTDELSINPISENKPFGATDNLDNYDLGSINGALTKGGDSAFRSQYNVDEATMLALKKYQQQRNFNDILKNTPDVNDAAVLFTATQDETLKNTLNTFEANGTINPSKRINEISAAQAVESFIAKDENGNYINPLVQEKAQNDKEFALSINRAENSLYQNFPKYAYSKLTQVIGQEMENRGMTNFFYNSPSKKVVDNLVDKLVEQGYALDANGNKIPFGIKEKVAYQQTISDHLDKSFLSQFWNGQTIKTTGWVEVGGRGLFTGGEQVGNAMRLIVNKTTPAQQLGLIASDKELQQEWTGQQAADAYTAIHGKTVLRQIISGGTELAASLLPLIVTDGFSELAGFGRLGRIATNATLFSGENYKHAVTTYPDDPLKQYTSFALSSAIDGGLAEFLPTHKINNAISQVFRRRVDGVLKDAVIDNLKTESITAVKNKLMNVVNDVVIKPVLKTVGETAQTATVLTLYGAAHGVLGVALGAPRNGGLDGVVKDAITNYETNFLSSLVLGGAAGAKEAIGGAVRNISSPSTEAMKGRFVDKLAKNAPLYKAYIEEKAKTDPATNAIKDELIHNLNEAQLIRHQLQTEEAANAMTPEQQRKYILTSLRQKIYEKKAEVSVDDVIKEDYLKKAKEAKAVKEKLWKNEDDAADHLDTPVVDEVLQKKVDAAPTEGAKIIAENQHINNLVLSETQQTGFDNTGKVIDNQQVEVSQLLESKRLDNKEIDKKIASIDPKTALGEVKVSDLEKERTNINDYYDTRISELNKSTTTNEVAKNNEPTKTEISPTEKVNPVEQPPKETAPVETKPAEKVTPTEIKPVETKPVETQPTEVKPVEKQAPQQRVVEKVTSPKQVKEGAVVDWDGSDFRVQSESNGKFRLASIHKAGEPMRFINDAVITDPEFGGLVTKSENIKAKPVTTDQQAIESLSPEEKKQYLDHVTNLNIDEAQKILDSKKTPQQGAASTEIRAQNVNEIDSKIENATTEDQKTVLQNIKNVASTITQTVPDSKVILHDTNESFTEAYHAAGGTGAARGFFDNGKEIHINLEYANNETAFHEGAHQIFSHLFNNSPEFTDKFYNQLQRILPDFHKTNLTRFVESGYPEADNQTKRDEFVTEFFARVASGKINLDKVSQTTFEKIKELIRKTAEKIGLNPKYIGLDSKKDVVAFAKRLHDAFAEGKKIENISKAKNKLLEDTTRPALRAQAIEGDAKEYKIGITNAAEKDVDELIGTRLDHARLLEQAGRYDEANAIYKDVVRPAGERVKDAFRDLPEISVEVNPTKGNFFNTTEPTLETTIRDEDSHTNEIIARMADLGQQWKQWGVHVSEILDRVPEGEKLGVELQDKSVYEPNLEIRFGKPLSEEEIKSINEIIKSGQKYNEKGDLIEGLAGSTLHSDNQGLTLYNISTLKPHEQFISETNDLLATLHGGGIQFQVEQNARKLWNIGNSEGQGLLSYDQAKSLRDENGSTADQLKGNTSGQQQPTELTTRQGETIPVRRLEPARAQRFETEKEREKYNSKSETQFLSDLQKHYRGDLNPTHTFELGFPTESVRSSGIPDAPIILHRGTLSYKEAGEYHDLSIKEISQIHEAIQKPLMVFQSATRGDSKIIVTDVKKDGRNLAVIVEKSRNGENGKNKINSIYPVSEKQISGWKRDNLLEWDRNKETSNQLKQSQQFKPVGSQPEAVSKLPQDFQNSKLENAKASAINKFDEAKLRVKQLADAGHITPEDAQAAYDKIDEQQKTAIAQEDRTSSVKNAEVAAKRKEFNLAEIENPIIRYDSSVRKEATNKIKKGYDVNELIDRVLAEKDQMNDVETEIIGRYIAGKEGEIHDFNSQIEEAVKSGKDISTLLMQRDRVISDLNTAHLAARRSGTEQARAFRQRQVVREENKTLADRFAEASTVSGRTKMTGKEIKDITDLYNKEKTKRQEYQKELRKERATRKRLEAKQNVDKIKKVSVKSTTKDYAKEKKTITQNIFDKLSKFRSGDLKSPDNGTRSMAMEGDTIPTGDGGDVNQNRRPVEDELREIAPDLNKYVRVLVDDAKGNISFDAIVNDVHSLLQQQMPDITKDHVVEFLSGEYNPKRKSKSEIAAMMETIRLQSKAIDDLNKILSTPEPTNESELKKRIKKIEKLKEKIPDLNRNIREITEAKKDVKATIKRTPEQIALDNIKKRTQKQIDELRAKIAKGDYSPDVKKQPTKLDKEAQGLKDELISLRVERQEYLNKLAQERKGWFTDSEGKAWWKGGILQSRSADVVTEIMNAPRTLMASMDFSAPLRQGLVASAAHPIIASKAFAEMFKQAFSEKRYNRWLDDLYQSDHYQVMKEAGLYIADKNNHKLNDKEERFMNNIVERIPFVGTWLVKGSERAYTSYLNKMRVDVFMDAADTFMKDGKTPENHPELYKAWASFVNSATGRGSLGKFEEAGQVLNTVFFSPRLIASRVNLLADFATLGGLKSVPTEIRVRKMRDLLLTVGFGFTTMMLAKLAAQAVFNDDDKNKVSVEPNPHSSDFGKLKIGNTRIDVWGGFQQYIRFTAQVLPAAINLGFAKIPLGGGYVKTTSGKTYSLDKKEFPFKDRKDIARSFIEGKLAPVPSLIWNSFKNPITGEGQSARELMYNNLLPLSFQDIWDAGRDGGVKRALFAVPTVFGVGVNTYQKKK